MSLARYTSYPVRHRGRTDAVVRVYDREPDTDDASDMYVLAVFGVDLRIRRRTDGRVFVHIDTDKGLAPGEVLAVEVRNGGENDYGEPVDDLDDNPAERSRS